jgi:hypothetical protein
MFAFWPLGNYLDILGRNRKILLRNHGKFEKNYNHIFTSILNPSESSYGKCHILLFLVSQTRFVYLLVILGQKPQILFYENL